MIRTPTTRTTFVAIGDPSGLELLILENSDGYPVGVK